MKVTDEMVYAAIEVFRKPTDAGLGAAIAIDAGTDFLGKE